MGDEERDPQTYAVIGAAMEVHRVLGNGFKESVYQEALALELTERGIPFEREVRFAVNYKGSELESTFYADFVCYGELIVELKALSKIGELELSQVINYLKASETPRAALITFGTPKLQYRRVVWSNKTWRNTSEGSRG